MNIYSKDCYPAMLQSFKLGEYGENLATDWFQEMYSGNIFLLVFTWPYFVLQWLIQSGTLLADPTSIPPETAEGYEDDSENVFWYASLSQSSQIILPWKMYFEHGGWNGEQFYLESMPQWSLQDNS